MNDAKHYGASYLTDTGDFLKQLKIHSYTPFLAVKEGVVLELGCGTGMDALNLTDMLSDEVHVVGIDHDAVLIEQAKAAIGLRKNINFLQGEVYQLDFEEEAVSGIRIERVIQHLSQPEVMFREVYRVLRLGQPLVIVETIWNSVHFYTEYVGVEQKIRNYLTDRKVNNGWAGNKLTADLRSNGFREIQLDTHCMVVRSKEEAHRYLFLDQILLEMVDKGLLSKDENADFSSALMQADEMGHFICSMNLVIVRAIK